MTHSIPPGSIEFVKKQKTSGWCWGISASKEKILCSIGLTGATDGGVEIRSIDLRLETKIEIPGSTYSAQQLRGGKLITKSCNHMGRTFLTSLGTVTNPIGTIIHEVGYNGNIAFVSDMAATDNQIAVIDYVEKQLRVFTATGDHQLNISLADMQWPRGVHLLPYEPAALVTDRTGGELRKYPLTAAAKPVWRCRGLGEPTGVTTDESGLIYVCSHKLKAIHLITEMGLYKFQPLLVRS